MNRKYGVWLFAGLVLLIPTIVFGIVIWTEKTFKPLPVLGSAAYQWNAYRFHDQSRQTIGPADWRGKILVAHFFFTHCLSVCPRMIINLKGVRNNTDSSVLILSLTADPERDSSGQLAAYGQRLGLSTSGWQFLTGEKIDLYRFGRKNLQLAVTDGDGGPQDFIHSDNLVLIDQNLDIRGYYDGTSAKEIEHLITAIRRLEKETQ